MSYTKEYYMKLVTSQYQNSPKFLSWLEGFIDRFTLSNNVLDEMDTKFDLDNAIGVQLDTLGVIVGQKRITNMSDSQYRVLLKIKIIKNMWNGIIQDLYKKWDVLFSSPLFIHDKQDMSLDVYLAVDNSEETSSLLQLLEKGLVIPKPQGVQLNYNLKYEKKYPAYVGMAIAQTGERDIKISIPENVNQNVYIGMAILKTGNDYLKISLPIKATSTNYVGALLTYQGHITIPAKIE